MITNAIIATLDSNITDLTVAENLFAEEGRGTKHVVVSVTTTVPQVQTIIEQRISTINAQLVGYNVEEGSSLAESIHAVIRAMGGSYTHSYEKTGQTETFYVDSVVVMTEPVIARKDNIRVITMNYEFHYKYTIQ